MAIETHDSSTLLAKIVLWGGEGSGRATAFGHLAARVPESFRDEVAELDLGQEKLLTVEIQPPTLAPVAGRTLFLQLATATGPTPTPLTCQRLLADADGVLFVADSRPQAHDRNVEALHSLADTLSALEMDPRAMPVVFLLNQRDRAGALPVEELNRRLNRSGVPYFETVAVSGYGLFRAFKTMVDIVEYVLRGVLEAEEPTAPAAGEETAGGQEGEAAGQRYAAPTVEEDVVQFVGAGLEEGSAGDRHASGGGAGEPAAAGADASLEQDEPGADTGGPHPAPPADDEGRPPGSSEGEAQLHGGEESPRERPPAGGERGGPPLARQEGEVEQSGAEDAPREQPVRREAGFSFASGSAEEARGEEEGPHKPRLAGFSFPEQGKPSASPHSSFQLPSDPEEAKRAGLWNRLRSGWKEETPPRTRGEGKG